MNDEKLRSTSWQVKGILSLFLLILLFRRRRKSFAVSHPRVGDIQTQQSGRSFNFGLRNDCSSTYQFLDPLRRVFREATLGVRSLFRFGKKFVAATRIIIQNIFLLISLLHNADWWRHISLVENKSFDGKLSSREHVPHPEVPSRERGKFFLCARKVTAKKQSLETWNFQASDKSFENNKNINYW